MTRQLSLKSSLDVLKQDAKRWLKALRSADAESRQRLAAAWPAAPSDPTLRDVQHALAREYGYQDWKALVTAVEDMTLDRQSHAERVELVLRHGWDGDVATARRIAARYPEVRRDSVFTAAACGDVDEVKSRLAREPQLAKAVGGSMRWTALACVSYSRLDAEQAVTIAQLLLDAGADPNFQFDDGWGSPFKIITGAIGLGEGVKPTHPLATELVELLIARGADPFDTQALYNSSIVHDDITWTAMLWRACEQRGRTAIWSVREGDVLNGPIKVGTLNYLLGNAVANNHLTRAAWLLAHGADANTPHSYSGHPVHTMARLSGFTDMATLLMQYGAQPEALHGERALLAAVMHGDEADVRQRLALEPHLIKSHRLLLTAAERGNVRAVSLLLSLGADVHATDHQGTTAMHNGAHAGSVPVIDVLLAAGAAVDARDWKWKGTPMMWAVVLGKHAVQERLAPVTRDVFALARTAHLERLAAVLAEQPALANEQLAGRDDPTALFYLPDDEQAAVEVAQLLLAHGADVQAVNKAGRTPEQAARLRGLDEAADLLQQR